jgi:hypothetical protein
MLRCKTGTDLVSAEEQLRGVVEQFVVAVEGHLRMSALPPKADILRGRADVR